MNSRWLSAAWAVGVAAAFATHAQAQAVYADVSVSAGLLPQFNENGQTNGLSAIDFDDDGDVDLFVPQKATQPNLFYRNNGDGTFTEIGGTIGLASVESARVSLWFDYDADHDLDLFLANDNSGAPTRYRLFRNDAGTFTDVTAGAGLFIYHFPNHAGGACAGDINNDGYLDLFVDGWGDPRRLFLNNTNGTFTEISASAGLAASGLLWQPVMYDFNRDGWTDIYMAIDAGKNELWINQQNGTFVNVALAAGAANNMNDMGVTLGDYDNDGDMDIYITNIYRNGPPFGYRNNVLYRNDTVGSALAFVDVSAAMGVEWGGWGWGTTFIDCDNDTLLDIAATNGYGNADGSSPNGDQSRLYRNVDGTSPFQNITASSQFSDTDWGSALVALDYDRDGDLDLAQICMAGPLRLLRNDLPHPAGQNGYLVVRPRHPGANHFAIGATVTARIGSLTMTRLISAGTSLQGQEPAEAFFGVASASLIDEVTVHWPDGTQTSVTDVQPNQVLLVSPAPPPPSCPGDIDESGGTDVFDFAILASHFGSTGLPPFTDGDLDGNGTVDVFDFAVLASGFGCVQ